VLSTEYKIPSGAPTIQGYAFNAELMVTTAADYSRMTGRPLLGGYGGANLVAFSRTRLQGYRVDPATNGDSSHAVFFGDNGTVGQLTVETNVGQQDGRLINNGEDAIGYGDAYRLDAFVLNDPGTRVRSILAVNIDGQWIPIGSSASIEVTETHGAQPTQTSGAERGDGANMSHWLTSLQADVAALAAPEAQHSQGL